MRQSPLPQAPPQRAHDEIIILMKIIMTACFVIAFFAYLLVFIEMFQIYTLLQSGSFGALLNAQAISGNIIFIIVATIFGQFFVICGLLCLAILSFFQ